MFPSKEYRKEYKAWLYARRCGFPMYYEWDASFIKFLLDVHPAPSPEHILSRFDKNAGYSKNNCEWMTLKEAAVWRREYRRWLFKKYPESEWYNKPHGEKDDLPNILPCL